MSATPKSRAELAAEIIALGQSYYARGWVYGTGGNFSAVLARDPLRLLVTASGRHKGTLRPEDLVEVDASGTAVGGDLRPSDETSLHLVIARERPDEVGAVLHTHSVAGTLLSRRHLAEGGIAFEGWEMLKGLTGVTTHEQREWLPIVANSQDYDALPGEVQAALGSHPRAHGVLLAGHGLYTWGRDLQAANRQLEIIEFLLEVTLRS